MGHGFPILRDTPHCCDSQREFLKPEATSTSPVIWIIRVLAWRIGMTQSRHGCHVQQMELPRSHNLGSRSALGDFWWLFRHLSETTSPTFPFIVIGFGQSYHRCLLNVGRGSDPSSTLDNSFQVPPRIVKPVPWELWISLGWWWLIVSCW